MILNKKKYQSKLEERFRKYSEKKSSKVWLGILSFAESSFFPIPVDPLLLVLLMDNKEKGSWWKLSWMTTWTSVLGGLFGYLIGFLFFNAVGAKLIAFYGLEESFKTVVEMFNTHGFSTIFIAAFTPIPYKIFTLAAGFAHVNLIPFIAASILGRGIRYFLSGILMRFFGEKVSMVFFKYLKLFSIIVVVLLVFYILKHFI